MTAPAVRLRLLEPGDVPVLTRLVCLNREFLADSGPLRTDDWFTAEGQGRAIATSLSAAAAGTAHPMLVLDADGDPVGTLNINSIIRGAFQSASLGYWVIQERNGEGIATAAVAAAKQIAFDELGLHRLQGETLVDNVASQRVLLKNGFVRYGQAPDYLKIAGRWQEHVLYQVIAPDDGR